MKKMNKEKTWDRISKGLPQIRPLSPSRRGLDAKTRIYTSNEFSEALDEDYDELEALQAERLKTTACENANRSLINYNI